jgi:MFS family permease
LTSGVLSGRLGWGRTFALSQVGVGASMLLLLLAGQVLMLYAAIAIYGVSQGARAVSAMGTMGRIFGMRGLGELTGIMMAAAQLGGAAGPYAAGYMYDALGSYGSVLVALAVMLLACGALILRFLVDPSVRSNARPEVAQPL